jgi:hypothetical protein
VRFAPRATASKQLFKNGTGFADNDGSPEPQIPRTMHSTDSLGAPHNACPVATESISIDTPTVPDATDAVVPAPLATGITVAVTDHARIRPARRSAALLLESGANDADVLLNKADVPKNGHGDSHQYGNRYTSSFDAHARAS